MFKFFSSWMRNVKMSCKEFPSPQTDEEMKRRDDAIVEKICSLRSGGDVSLQLDKCVTSDDLKRLKEKILSCPD